MVLCISKCSSSQNESRNIKLNTGGKLLIAFGFVLQAIIFTIVE